MKKIIDGKRYNTETATKLGTDSFGNPGDFSFWYEALYRTTKGAYFLAGHGGPRSHYACATGQNETSGGRDLVLMSEQEARRWLEEHGTAEQMEQAFGSTVIEG